MFIKIGNSDFWVDKIVEIFMFQTKYYSIEQLETKAKVIMEVIFEPQGRVKMAEKWLHKNVNISPKKTVTCENFL